MSVVIHHYPGCSKSRAVLALIQDAGYDPVVIPYMETGWTRPQLQALFAVAGLSARDALRTSGGVAQELGLLEPGVSEDALLDAMVENPVLVERPLVCTPRGVRLCRPVDAVLELLEGVPDPT